MLERPSSAPAPLQPCCTSRAPSLWTSGQVGRSTVLDEGSLAYAVFLSHPLLGCGLSRSRGP